MTGARDAIAARGRGRSATGWLLCALLACAGCDRPVKSEATQDLAVPVPATHHLEAVVQRDLDLRRAKFDAAIAKPGADAAKLAEEYGEMGLAYSVYRMYEAARACFANAERYAQEDYRWPYYLAFAHQSDGHLEEAEACYLRALARSPDDVPTLIRLVQVAREQNDLATAEKHCRRALEIDPKNARAHYSLGRIAFDQERWEEAVEHLQQLPELAKGSNEFYFTLGLALKRLGRTAEGEAAHASYGQVGVPFDEPLVRKILTYNVGWRQPNTLGTQAAANNDLETAYRELLSAVEKAPVEEMSLPLGNLGAVEVRISNSLQDQGDLVSAQRVLLMAMEHIERSLDLDPANARANFNYGTILATSLLEFELALPYYRRSLEEQPDQRDANHNLATALLRLGRIEESLVALGNILELYPNDFDARLLLCRCLLILQRYDEARVLLEESIVAHADRQREFGSLLARLLATRPANDADRLRALELAQKYATPREGKPVRPSWQRITLGLALAGVGRVPEGIAELEAERKVCEEFTDDEDRVKAARDGIPEIDGFIAALKQGQPVSRPWLGHGAPSIGLAKEKPLFQAGEFAAAGGKIRAYGREGSTKVSDPGKPAVPAGK